MRWPDLVNAGFELLGGLLIWANVGRLRRDRMVRGVDWRVTAFFQAWGMWNVYFYPSLDQWASFTGGLVICAANSVWLYYAFRYRRN